jgi:hypothetical protein
MPELTRKSLCLPTSKLVFSVGMIAFILCKKSFFLPNALLDISNLVRGYDSVGHKVVKTLN